MTKQTLNDIQGSEVPAVRATAGSARRTWSLGGLTLTCALGLVPFDTTSTASPAPPEAGQATVEEARTAVEQWVATRRVISAEKRDWALGREILTERIDIVRREIESLRARIATADESVAGADRKRTELEQEQELSKQASEALSSTVVQLERRTKALLARVPEPLRERVKPLSQRFPEDPESTKLSLGERFQSVIGVLNEVNKFQREITVTSEVRSLPDGSSAEVTVLYLGIARAYYVDAQGEVAGTGTASEQGWVWSANDLAAPQIAAAIAVLAAEREAAFVQLPVEIE